MEKPPLTVFKLDFSQVKIETERLLLVSTSQKYADDIFVGYQEPVTQYMNHPPASSLEAIKDRLKTRENEMKAGEVLYLAVLKEESEEFVGHFSLENLDQKDPEIGGWLKKSAHGNGYGAEVVSAMRDWAREHLNTSHLIWPCASLNISSCKLAESLGGTVQRTYEKQTAAGKVFTYVEYWIPAWKT